jgi:hypothetical protein
MAWDSRERVDSKLGCKASDIAFPCQDAVSGLHPIVPAHAELLAATPSEIVLPSECQTANGRLLAVLESRC